MQTDDMKTNEPLVVEGEPKGVQRDSETPLPQKPSFLFFLTTGLVVLTMIVVTYGAYRGIVH